MSESLNLRRLEHLLALAETASFSRAAERCHITQSALSRSIQGLEQALEVLLIDRIGKRCELTPFGQVVAARARRMVLDAAELRRSVQLLKDGELGAIRVGLGSGPSAMLMRPLLGFMARNHPQIEVSITPGATEVQTHQLRVREFDALVVDARRVEPAADLLIADLGEMRAGLVCRAEHPLQQLGRAVSFDELRRYPLASTPLSAEVARLLIALYGPAADPQAAVRLRCDDIPSLIETVEDSDAIFLGILGAARAGLASGRLVVLDTEPAFNVAARFSFVTLAGRTEAPALAILRRFVADHLKD